MIKSISNLSRKSFVNYSMPSDLEFAEKNVFFGHNGRGKSSFASGLKDHITSVLEKNNEEIRFFSNEYLEVQLLDENSGRLKGVRALAGKENIATEGKIQELKRELKDTTSLEKDLIAANIFLQNQLKSVAEAIVGTAKANRLKMNYFDSNNQSAKDYRESLQRDVGAALKVVPQEELDTYRLIEDFDSRRNAVTKLPVLNFEALDQEELSDVQRILHEEYSNEKIPTKALLDWIEVGLRLHRNEGATKCLFCGKEEPNYSEIEEDLEKHIANRKQKDRDRLSKIEQKLTSLHAKVSDFYQKKDLFLGLIKLKELGQYFDSLILVLTPLKDLIEVVRRKLENMEEVETNDYPEYQSIQRQLEDLSAKISASMNATLESIDREEAKINVVLKGAFANRILKDKAIWETIEEELKKKDNLDNQRNQNAKIEAEIRHLKDSLSPIGGFAAFVNETLANLEVKFFLRPEGNEYWICPKEEGAEITSKDISEGERNLLSLLFFYYEMFEDDRLTQLKDEIKYVIIDDPISSYDDNNRLYVITLMRNILEWKGIQSFIFFHGWEDFCNTVYGMKAWTGQPNSDLHLYEILKDSGGKSFLRRTKNLATPYEHDFFELLANREKSEDQLDESDIHHLPNCARRVLQAFLEFKSVNSSPTMANFDSVFHALYPNETTQSGNAKHDIAVLLNVTNLHSHSPANNAAQVLRAVKFLLKRIEMADSLHFQTMVDKRQRAISEQL